VASYENFAGQFSYERSFSDLNFYKKYAVITGTANGKMKLWEVDMTLYANQICSLIDSTNKKLTFSTWKRYMCTSSINSSEEKFYLDYFTRRNKERCP
jgi:hypothetical protein